MSHIHKGKDSPVWFFFLIESGHFRGKKKNCVAGLKTQQTSLQNSGISKKILASSVASENILCDSFRFCLSDEMGLTATIVIKKINQRLPDRFRRKKESDTRKNK